jgi:nitrite reductase/ring-hydroxylating ferredoxin subunit
MGVLNLCDAEEVFAAGKKIVKASRLTEGRAVKFSYKGKKYILIKYSGSFYCYINYCTHKGGPLESQDGKFVCQWHHATFDISSGAKLSGPAKSNLTKIAVEVREGYVYMI